MYSYFYDENQHQNSNLPTFSPQNLQDALEFLDKNRPTILQKALDLEKVIFENKATAFTSYKASINFTKTDPDHNIFIEYVFAALPTTTLLNIIEAEVDAETIYKLRNRIIHNEVPYNDYLCNLVKNIPQTPLQVTEFIINHTIHVYEQLAAVV